ncbi:MAG: plastocyanin/azurin family copper-binding protein [Acidimicrobiales bacterium]
MADNTRNRVLRVAAVLAVALTLGACGGGGDKADGTGDGKAAAGAPATSSEVTIQGFMFKDKDVSVAAGTTVTWTNMDDNAHSIKDQGGLFPTSQELAKGDTFSHTYDKPGAYPYTCGIHPYMKGTVTVS